MELQVMQEVEQGEQTEVVIKLFVIFVLNVATGQI